MICIDALNFETLKPDPHLCILLIRTSKARVYGKEKYKLYLMQLKSYLKSENKIEMKLFSISLNF